MKNVLIIIGLCISTTIMAQESKVDTLSNLATLQSNNDTTKHEVIGDSPIINKNGDTTKIRLGSKGITIVERDGKTTVNIDNGNDSTSKSNNFEKKEEENHFFKDFVEKWDKPKANKFRPHFGGVELFLNNYMNSQHSTLLSNADKYMELNVGRSLGVNLNLIEYGVPFSSFTGLVTGLGIEFNSYYFKGANNIQVDSIGVIVNKPFNIPKSSYEKTKFRDTYLTIPLLYELQFQKGKKRPFYISFGVIGGLKIGSSTKEIYNQNSSEVEHIVDGGINISTFRYGFQARMGFSIINIFATYYASPLFDKNAGPELYPFNVGITLVSF